MDSKSAVFVAVSSLLVMVIYSTSMNFVSAEVKCYTSGSKYICIATYDVEPPTTLVSICDAGTNENCTFHWLDKVSPVTPEVNNIIKDAELEHRGIDNSNEGRIDNKGAVDKNTPMAPK